MSRHYFQLSFIIASVLAAFVLLIFAANVFPIPGTDSIVFLPPAILYAKGHGFINPLYHISVYTDEANHNNFNYYVPLYSYLLGVACKIKPGVKTIFICCSLIGVTNITLYGSNIFRTIAGRRLTKIQKCFVLLSVGYVAIYLLPTTGRPEILTSLLCFLMYVAYRNRGSLPTMVYHLAITLLLACELSTQISCFYFSVIVLATYDLLNEKSTSRVILTNIGRGVLAMLLCALILYLSPNGLTNTLKGLSIHIGYVFTRSDRTPALFWHYWVAAPQYPAFAGLFLMAAVLYIRELWRKLSADDNGKKIVIAILQVGLVAGFFKFVLYAAPTVYNATQFIMPLMVYVVSELLQIKQHGLRRCITYLGIATTAAGCIALLRWVALYPDYKMQQRDFDSASVALKDIKQQYGNVYITNSLWSLSDDLANTQIYYGQQLQHGDVIVVQQVNHSLPEEVICNWQLISDHEAKGKSKLLGVTLANRPQCFGFSVYRVK
jgi:hypothetical protein